MIVKLDNAVDELKKFMESQGLECKPGEVSNLRGDAARCKFINIFKEVQRLKTQIEQYTEIEEKDAAKIMELLPEDTMRAFRGAYMDMAQRLKAAQGKEIENKDSEVEADLILSLFCFLLLLLIMTTLWHLFPGTRSMSRKNNI